jgi:hypothetical protein
MTDIQTVLAPGVPIDESANLAAAQKRSVRSANNVSTPPIA